jgi:hypothetical protein
MAREIALRPLRYTFTALLRRSATPCLLNAAVHLLTHPMSTYFGRVVFGSLTLTNANWIRPSEKSSIRSTSSPSIIDLISSSNSTKEIQDSYLQCFAPSAHSPFRRYLVGRHLPEVLKPRTKPTVHKSGSTPQLPLEQEN